MAYEFDPITINSGIVNPQPSRVREYQLRQDSEEEALDGSIQRNTITSPTNPTGRKYVAELAFEKLNISQFQAVHNLFTTGSGVYYRNPNSKFGILTFSGLPFVDDQADYEPGASFLSDYKVRIRQI